MDATTVYQEIEEVVRDELYGDLRLSYVRDVDHAGNQNKHLFVIMGVEYDVDFFPVMAELIEDLDPDNVDIGSAAEKAHIRISFNSDRIENAPPESAKSYIYATNTGDPVSVTVDECANCRRVTERSVPPIVVRYRSESPFAKPDEEHLHLCVSCSPGNFDDVVRAVEAFGVEDGEVTELLFEERYEDEDTGRWVTEQNWYDVDEVDNPYIEDVIKVLERDHL